MGPATAPAPAIGPATAPAPANGPATAPVPAIGLATAPVPAIGERKILTLLLPYSYRSGYRSRLLT